MVYLLHFSRPLAHARHYIGSTKFPDPVVRLRQHQAGAGARITQVAVESGIELQLVRIWAGGRKLERRLKRRHEAPRLCPICRAQSA